MDFDAFLSWEQTTRDTLDIKRIYIDMADDLVSGIVLSQIVYWYLPSKKHGGSKITIRKGDKEWIAKARHEWWDEIRVSPKQVDLALIKLVKLGILEVATYKFNNAPTKHIRILKQPFMELWQETIKNAPVNPFLPKGENRVILTKGENENSPKVEIKNDETGKSLTESTAKPTAKREAPAQNGAQPQHPSKEVDTAVFGQQSPEPLTPSSALPLSPTLPRKNGYDAFEIANVVPPFQKAYEEAIGAGVNLSQSDQKLIVAAFRKGYTAADVKRVTLAKMREKGGSIPVFRFVLNDLHLYPAKPMQAPTPTTSPAPVEHITPMSPEEWASLSNSPEFKALRLKVAQ